MAEGLRPYGPGKYDTMLDAYIHGLTLAGCDDEAGSVDELGWYGLLRGLSVDGPFVDASEAQGLTRAELAYLRQHKAGAIVSADSQGFVHVEYFTSTRALVKAWDEVQAECASVDEEA